MSHFIDMTGSSRVGKCEANLKEQSGDPKTNKDRLEFKQNFSFGISKSGFSWREGSFQV
jgi:hypothetical protein